MFPLIISQSILWSSSLSCVPFFTFIFIFFIFLIDVAANSEKFHRSQSRQHTYLPFLVVHATGRWKPIVVARLSLDDPWNSLAISWTALVLTKSAGKCGKMCWMSSLHTLEEISRRGCARTKEAPYGVRGRTIDATTWPTSQEMPPSPEIPKHAECEDLSARLHLSIILIDIRFTLT